MALDDGFHETYRRVLRLCEIGMRPPFILQLTRRAMPDKQVHAIYRSINGENASRGQLSEDTLWYVTGHLKRLHSSTFFRNYRALLDAGVDHIDAVIAGYSLYTEIMKSSGEDIRLSADRAYLLTLRMRSHSGLSITECKTCASQYIHETSKAPDDHRECPACNFAPAKKMSEKHRHAPVVSLMSYPQPCAQLALI